jgi:hypothetical protein
MHPINARKFFRHEVCVGLTEEDNEFLKFGKVLNRGRQVETEVRSDAVETATTEPVKKSGTRRLRASGTGRQRKTAKST